MQIEFTKRANRQMRKLPSVARARLTAAINAYADNQDAGDVIHLASTDNAYRLRVGDYRALLTLDEAAEILTVYRVGHRKDVYD